GREGAPEAGGGLAEPAQARLARVGVGRGAGEAVGPRDPPAALARAGPLPGLLVGDAERSQVAPPCLIALPLLPAHLPQPSAEPFVEPLEYGGRVGQCEVGRPAGRVAIDQPDPFLDRDALATRGQPSRRLLD